MMTVTDNERLYISVPSVALAPCFGTGALLVVLSWAAQTACSALLCCRRKTGLRGLPPTPLAFVIGENRENLSPTGQLFPAGRGQSIPGAPHPATGCSKKWLCVLSL